MFNGEVTEEELDFIIEAGLIYMVEHGMLPFKGLDADTSFAPHVSGEMQ